jgi:hypothetical protein
VVQRVPVKLVLRDEGGVISRVPPASVQKYALRTSASYLAFRGLGIEFSGPDEVTESGHTTASVVGPAPVDGRQATLMGRRAFSWDLSVVSRARL